MSLVKSKAIQLGFDATPTNNFLIYQPLTPDGTFRIANGNQGATTDIMTVTSGGSVTFAGTTNFSSLNFSAGSESAPSLFPTGDSNTGIWFPAADTFAVSTGGTERLRVASGGNVGIGQTNPLYKLDVNRGTAGNIARFTDGVAQTLVIQSPDASGIKIKNDNNGYLSFAGTSAEWMRIDSSGNVGIGTSSPVSRLDIFGSVQSGVINTAAIIQSKFLNNETKLNALLGPKYATLQIVGSDNNENSPGSIAIISPSVGLTGSSRGPELYFVSTRATTAQLAAGTYSQPQSGDGIGGIVFGGDTGGSLRGANAGIYSNAYTNWTSTNRDTSIVFTTTPTGSVNPAQRMYIAPSGDILLGGLTTSAGQADPNSTAGQMLALNTKRELRWWNTNASIYGGAGGADDNLYYYSGLSHIWRSSSTDRMRLDANGNLLLGSATNAQGRFNVAVQGGASTDFSINVDASFIYFQTWNNKPLKFNAEGNNILLLPAGGNLGVGTVSPATKLDVNGRIKTTNAVQTEYNCIAHATVFAGGKAGYISVPTGSAWTRLDVGSTNGGLPGFTNWGSNNSYTSVDGNYVRLIIGVQGNSGYVTGQIELMHEYYNISISSSTAANVSMRTTNLDGASDRGFQMLVTQPFQFKGDTEYLYIRHNLSGSILIYSIAIEMLRI